MLVYTFSGLFVYLQGIASTLLLTECSFLLFCLYTLDGLGFVFWSSCFLVIPCSWFLVGLFTLVLTLAWTFGFGSVLPLLVMFGWITMFQFMTFFVACNSVIINKTNYLLRYSPSTWLVTPVSQ